MLDPPPLGGNFPPTGTTRRVRPMPPWMDKDNENGELKYLVLQMANDSALPVNPFIVGKTIKDAVGSDLSEFGRKIDSGKKLLLKTRNQSQFEKLQKITKLIDGTLVKVASHVTLNNVQCVIFAPDLKGLSDEDILENLSDQKVMNVRRFTRKVNGEIVPTNIFLLRINATSIPEFIRLGALQVKTRAYYPKPMQCFNCGQFGHTQIHCKLSPTCTNCGTPAHGECTVDPVCINCKDNHSTTSRTCPRYLQEEQVINYKIDNNCSYVYPQFDPIINGLQHNGVQHNYALGDFVVANCSSDMSSPPARLYWYINDRNVPSDYLQPQHESTVENDGFQLRQRTLEIRFYIDEKRLGKLKGKLVLKCLARIDAIPQATRESTQIIYIPTTDELRNQKLINWRGSDASSLQYATLARLSVLFTVTLGSFRWFV